MSDRMTQADARRWICEAWGRDIPEKDVRLRGDWLFVRVDDEVECVHAPNSGDIWGEPWDVIGLEDSPFVPKNETAVAASIVKLDAAIAEYQKEGE